MKLINKDYKSATVFCVLAVITNMVFWISRNFGVNDIVLGLLLVTNAALVWMTFRKLLISDRRNINL